ncbi:STAS domain-containing protein [Streptomyces sp. NPDC006703]|uniref:STAS domain-containing protein n=2 Tax=unclassified Streptomyces TaxID=2593676 RepID=UPI0036834D34
MTRDPGNPTDPAAEPRPRSAGPGTRTVARRRSPAPPLSTAARRAALPGTDEVRTVALTGSLGLTTVPAARERLLRACDGPGISLLLDLSGVTSCDTLGLGLLVAMARRARSFGSGLRLVAPSPAVARALEDSGLIRLFCVCPDIDTSARTPGTGTPGPVLPEAA